jgi:hypothetical protein
LHSKASLLIQALFIDFRDVRLCFPWTNQQRCGVILHQKRAIAKKALLSKKQTFETTVRMSTYLAIMKNSISFQESTASRGCKLFYCSHSRMRCSLTLETQQLSFRRLRASSKRKQI